jgi:hypothetical protein
MNEKPVLRISPEFKGLRSLLIIPTMDNISFDPRQAIEETTLRKPKIASRKIWRTH